MLATCEALGVTLRRAGKRAGKSEAALNTSALLAHPRQIPRIMRFSNWYRLMLGWSDSNRAQMTKD